MEKLQTPVMAGMGGAAILAALLSFGGGDRKPTPPAATPETKGFKGVEAEKDAAPNQDGPWRAVCEEYAPYGFGGKGGKDPSQIPRGYKVFLRPNASGGTTEVNTKPDRQGQTYKITVHKQLVGDLTSCIPPGELGKLHLIIATLPDPDKTEMRLDFDRNVNALERGAEITGFHYTGYWFPWRSQQTGEIPRKEDEVEAVLLRNEQPGVLLFHNDDGARLFIFVVGETPTSGINRIQMTQAIRYRQDLLACYQKAMMPSGTSRRSEKAIGKGLGAECTPPNDRPDSRRSAGSDDGVQASKTSPPVKQLAVNTKLDGPLRIAGPHFSGSFVSLHEVLAGSGYLASTTDTSRSVEIISPNASSDDLIRTFANQCNENTFCYFKPLTVAASVANKTAANYLSRLGYKKENIVELVEDESGFGDTQSYKEQEGSDNPKIGSDSSPFGQTLTFPRELSAVRALAINRANGLQNQVRKSFRFPRLRLQLSSLAKTRLSEIAPRPTLQKMRPQRYPTLWRTVYV